MAKLSAHGKELDRRDYATSRIAVMEDGTILRNYGQGWKIYGRVKAGVSPQEFANNMRKKYDARPAEFHEYIGELINCTDLKHRAELHTMVEMMPTDPDGIWAHCDDRNNRIEIEDLARLCRAYLRAQKPNPPAPTPVRYADDCGEVANA